MEGTKNKKGDQKKSKGRGRKEIRRRGGDGEKIRGNSKGEENGKERKRKEKRKS